MVLIKKGRLPLWVEKKGVHFLENGEVPVQFLNKAYKHREGKEDKDQHHVLAKLAEAEPRRKKTDPRRLKNALKRLNSRLLELKNSGVIGIEEFRRLSSEMPEAMTEFSQRTDVSDIFFPTKDLSGKRLVIHMDLLEERRPKFPILEHDLAREKDENRKKKEEKSGGIIRVSSAGIRIIEF
ncbi:MAG: hypothetical protein ABID38_06535 [Candidatus Diapherotrites archaeon]